MTLIVATDKNGVIGVNGTIPWHLPADLKHFKEVTMGHSVIMGRKTWESIPAKYRPLTGRDNIVLSRSPDYKAEGARTSRNWREAVQAEDREAFVIGGGEVYRIMLPLCNRIILSVVDLEVEGDARFDFDANEWGLVASDQREGFVIETWERNNG
jgi:dihydrofolate reductase